MPKAAASTRKGVEKSKPVKKGKKDPNAPKRGLSAYMFFANDQRDKVRADQPDLKFGEVGKVLGEKWKALSDAQKAPYEKKAAADKKRYEDEKAAYNASESEVKAKSSTKSSSSGGGAGGGAAPAPPRVDSSRRTSDWMSFVPASVQRIFRG